VNTITSNGPRGPGQPAKPSSAWKKFKDRDDWIAAMLATSESALDWRAKVTATRIALHHNIETGQCDPSIIGLAAGCGVSENTIRSAIKTLEATGWVRVDRSRGRHRNAFQLLTPTLQTDCRVEPFKHVEGLDHDQPFNNRVPNPSTNSPNPSTCLHPNSESITAKRTAKRDSDSPPRLDLQGGDRVDPIETSFEIWYQQYPKRAAKAAALKAYRAVIIKKLATPEELLAGAMRYAAERSGQDPKYTKHPATWLNSACWADEPAKPAGKTIDADGIAVRPPKQPASPKYGNQFMDALAHAQRLKAQGGAL
jgi:hypothetical protein